MLPLSAFPPITLAEMDRVRLMERADRKYLLHLRDVSYFLESIQKDYTALQVANQQLMQYRTLYYDTPSWDLYQLHHNGIAPRWKVRYREYVASQIAFFEVKSKCNRGLTHKNRVGVAPDQLALSQIATSLVSQFTPLDPTVLEPAVWVNYKRLTLVHPSLPERVTIDCDLHLQREGCSENFGARLPGLVIVEVKQGSIIQTPAIQALRYMKRPEGGISKYCLAVCQLIKTVRSNNFKPDLLRLAKLLDESIAA